MEKAMGLDSEGERAQKCDRENRDWRWLQIKPSQASWLYSMFQCQLKSGY